MDAQIQTNAEQVISAAQARGETSVIVTVETALAADFEAWIAGTAYTATAQTHDYRLGLVPPKPDQIRSYYLGVNTGPGVFGPFNQYLLNW